MAAGTPLPTTRKDLFSLAPDPRWNPYTKISVQNAQAWFLLVLWEMRWRSELNQTTAEPESPDVDADALGSDMLADP